VDEQTLRALIELLEDPDRPDRDERLAQFRKQRDEIFHGKLRERQRPAGVAAGPLV
jgi:hypothetical protein